MNEVRLSRVETNPHFQFYLQTKDSSSVLVTDAASVIMWYTVSMEEQRTQTFLHLVFCGAWKVSENSCSEY